MKRNWLACLLAVVCGFSEMCADDVPLPGWSRTELWTSDVISARLIVKQSASLADKTWIGLEFENHTQQPLEFGQTWIELKRLEKDLPGERGRGLQLSGAMGSIKKLPPGRHQFFADTFRFASGNLGPPPAEKVQVDGRARVETALKDGRRFATPDNGPVFWFEWRYPSANELVGMRDELKEIFATPADLDQHLWRINVILMAREIVDQLTLADYLPLMKGCGSYNVRYSLLPEVFAKFADDPLVLAYYREAFQTSPDVVSQDGVHPLVWNDEFLEPLTQGYESGKWHYLTPLSRHTAAWRNKPKYTSRISSALLKQHPILKRNVRNIEDQDLSTWAKAVENASSVAAPNLISLLTPALEDKRLASIDLGAGGINKSRVCDRALFAILQWLDGDSWAAFKEAGITGWSTEEEKVAASQRMITVLKDRLKSLPPADKK